jgi:hypothetical protein
MNPEVRLLVLGVLIIGVLSRWMDAWSIACVLGLGIYYLHDKDKIDRSVREMMYGLTDEIEDANRVIFKENGIKKVRGIDEGTNMDAELSQILRRLKSYRRYNKVSYDQGYEYIRMFLNTVHELESDPSQPTHPYANAMLYLQTALNHFQSLTLSVPEKTQIQTHRHTHRQAKPGIKEPILQLEILGGLCRELQLYGSRRLYNLSLLLNRDWTETPSVATYEIVDPEIQPANTYMPHEFH